MTFTLSFTHFKGGIGKTTSCYLLGQILIRKGFRVLFVDMDLQGNLSLLMGGGSASPGTPQLLTEPRLQAEECIRHTEKKGDYIPGNIKMNGASERMGAYKVADRPRVLRSKLRPVQESGNYDFILIDTPAEWGQATRNAWGASDGLIIPVEVDIFAVQGFGLLAEAIEETKERNPGFSPLGMLFIRYRKGNPDEEAVRKAGEDFGFPTFESKIRYSEKFNDRKNSGLSLDDANTRKTAPYLDCLKLSEELLQLPQVRDKLN